MANPTKTKPILDILLKNKEKVRGVAWYGVVWRGLVWCGVVCGVVCKFGRSDCGKQMLDYLGKFHNDRDDEQFADEKQYLIKQIKDLQ